MRDHVRIAKHIPRGEVEMNGWSVPLLEAYERDGGTVDLVIDRRLAVTVDAAHFERVATFVADVIAVCWGYGAHPRDDDFDRSRFDRVPHPSLAPHPRVEIGSVSTSEATPDGEEGE